MSQTDTKDSSSYKSILKATSLFGGIQVYTILINIIKTKILAVILGPEGVGIEGLFKSGIELVQNVTSLGLSSSAVRDVADANGSHDIERISKTVHVVRKLVWLTGLLGLVVFAIASPWLSQFTFGNGDYTLSFIILSIVLLLDQVCAGQKVILQGLGKYKYLAKATAYGATFGLVISVPLYYLLGIKGVVPTLILNSACALLLSWFFSRKISLSKSEVSVKQTLLESKSMIKMGFSICLSTAEAALIAYLLRSFIRSQGGIEEVGLFQAGFVLMNSYVALVFNAMATDFYPRLANVNHDNAKCCEVINNQGIVASCLLTPILVAFIIYVPIAIYILYSDSFQTVGSYILWASLGMMFRLSSWLVSFMFLAKGVAKTFILNETLAKAYFFALNILGYKFGGLEGLGVAFAVSYFIYTIQVYCIAHRKYEFTYDKEFIKNFIVFTVFIITALAIGHFSTIFRYSLGALLLTLSLFVSIKILDNKMGIIETVRNRLRK